MPLFVFQTAAVEMRLISLWGGGGQTVTLVSFFLSSTDLSAVICN
jgi:hypothetical protein